MGLAPALQAAGLAKSSYYYQPIAREPRALDEELLAALRGVTGRELVYGVRKVSKLMRRRGRKDNWKKVYRHMGALKMLQPRKRKGLKPATLCLFSPLESNVLWEGDLTYVPVGVDGMAFAFAILDCYDWEVVGELFSQRCRAIEAVECLRKAVEKRFPGGIPEGRKIILRLRLDRGGQYIAREFRKAAKELGVQLEFCGIQSPNDKARIENFIGKYKIEEVWRNDYADFVEGKTGWHDYLMWFDEERLHQSLGYIPPKEFRERRAAEVSKCQAVPENASEVILERNSESDDGSNDPETGFSGSAANPQKEVCSKSVSSKIFTLSGV